MFDNKENFMFDLYGTLVDIKTDEDMPCLWHSLSNFYSMNGAAYSDADLRSEYMRLCENDAGDDVEIDLTKVFKALYVNRNIKPSAQLISDTAIMMRSVSILKLRLYDGAKDVLTELRKRGKKVYLFSNAQACFTVPELKALGLYDMFDEVCISSDLKVKKPSLMFYRKALAGKDPDRCVMIGNDEFADIRGALRAGMEACYIQTEQSPTIPVALPSVQIKSLREILN